MTSDSRGDLLYGAPAIAAYLGLTERQARHRLETGIFPSFKIGNTVCARKAKLDAAIAELEESNPGVGRRDSAA